MKITRAVVPSLFTVLNMVCGFMSIINAGHEDFRAASWFILLAAGFDALDGVMARITKSSSEFGVQIDSLSDVISFGAAPSYLAYKLYLIGMGGPGILISAMLMVFGAIRLARFNVQLVGFDKDHFVGLPIPAAAMTMASFTLDFEDGVSGLDGSVAFLIPWMIVLLSVLMVSRIPYDTLPKISRRAIRREPWKFAFFSLAVVVIFVTGGNAIFPLMVLFISLGIVRYIGTHIRRMLHAEHKFDEEESIEPTRIDP